MTITPVRERPPVSATPTRDFVVVGRYADGRPVRLAVVADGRSGGRAEHATIYGTTGSGVTTALRTILTDGAGIGWHTSLIDPATDGLSGVAVPLMLGAGPGHALAPELTLRPVLTEIGGSVPVRGLYVVDSAFDDPAAYESWLAAARRHVRLPEVGRA